MIIGVKLRRAICGYTRMIYSVGKAFRIHSYYELTNNSNNRYLLTQRLVISLSIIIGDYPTSPVL